MTQTKYDADRLEKLRNCSCCKTRGELLRNLRRAFEKLLWEGMSRQEVADRLGIHRTTLSSILTGNRPMSVDVIVRLRLLARMNPLEMCCAEYWKGSELSHKQLDYLLQHDGDLVLGPAIDLLIRDINAASRDTLDRNRPERYLHIKLEAALEAANGDDLARRLDGLFRAAARQRNPRPWLINFPAVEGDQEDDSAHTS